MAPSKIDISESTMLTVVPLWIDGTPTKSSSAQTFPVHSAAQGRDVYLAQSADVATAKAAADSSMKAFQTWKKVGPVYRRDLLMRVAAILSRRKDELKRIAIEETSCNDAWAEMNVNVAIENLYEVASRITSVAGEIPQMASSDHTALIFKEPIGPILSIAPLVAVS